MSDIAKRNAARAAVDLVESGMRLGLGTGSTAAEMIRLLGARVRDGLDVVAVSTSEQSSVLAQQEGIRLTTLDEMPELDLVIDGADEVDPALNLIKGGGGALLREKIVASCAARFVVIVDSGKCVEALGGFPLPVEVVGMAVTPLSGRIRRLGADVSLRRDHGDSPFFTDEGNHILDCAFQRIDDPHGVAASLAAMPGVVEHGLFIGMAERVIVGSDSGVDTLRP